MSSHLSLTGVLPVAQLPYYDDESIDFTTLTREINWLFEQGADGVSMAMVTEILRLTESERKAVAESVCRAAEGRGAAIISVGADCTVIAVELARHAEGVGATAVMANPPISVVALSDELLRYFERIVKAVALPVIVQDASAYVGRPMGIANMARILKEFGSDRILFKPESAPVGPQLSRLRDATGGQARVLEGSGGIALVDNFRRGIVGTMPGADLIEGIVAIWRALENGDDARAYEISLPLSGIVAMQSGLDGFLAVEKYLLVKQGVFRNCVVRGPVGFILDAESKHEIDRLFGMLQLAIARVA